VENVNADPKILIDIIRTRIPFGKYKDAFISDLPVYYLEWMHSKGFPPGKLGMLLSTVFEIKTNGLNDILVSLKHALRTGQIK